MEDWFNGGGLAVELTWGFSAGFLTKKGCVGLAGWGL